MKQFRSTLIMAVIVAGLAAYAYFGEFKKRQEQETVKEKAAVVVKIEKDKVSQVKLVKDSKSLSLLKDKDGWLLSEPVQDSADDDAVKGWLDNLTTEKSESEITEQIDWALFGLDKPVYTVEITGDGKIEKVRVGKDAIGGKIYLRHNDDNAVLIANAIWKGFGDKSAKDMRNKRIYRLEGKAATIITIDGQGPKVQLTKKDGKWLISGVEEAGEEEVRNYLNQVEALRATDVVAEDKTDKAALAKNDLKSPFLKLSLTFADTKEPWTLVVSKPNKQQEAFAYVSSLKPIYKIYSTSAESFLKGPSDFRDKKKPFTFQKAEVKQIDIKTGLADVVLVQKDGKWAMSDTIKTKPENTTKEVDQGQVDSLLSQLENLRAKDYLKGSATGLTKTMSLKGEGGKVVLELAWAEGAKDKNEYKVKSSNSKDGVTVEKASLDGLPVQTLLREIPRESPDPQQNKSKAPQASPPAGHS